MTKIIHCLFAKCPKMHKKMHRKNVQKNVHFFVQKRLTKQRKIGMVGKVLDDYCFCRCCQLLNSRKQVGIRGRDDGNTFLLLDLPRLKAHDPPMSSKEKNMEKIMTPVNQIARLLVRLTIVA